MFLTSMLNSQPLVQTKFYTIISIESQTNHTMTYW